MPSALSAIHESRLFGSMCMGCVANWPCPPAAFHAPSPAVKLTISAPAPFRKSRLVGFMEPRLGVSSDRLQHAGMGKAAAQHATQCLSNFLVARPRVYVQRGLCRQNHAAEAVPALRRAFIDEGLLNWMRFLRSAETFERGDLVFTGGAHRHHARAHHLAAKYHRARAALRHATAESRPSEAQLIAEHKQERHLRIDRDHVPLTVYM